MKNLRRVNPIVFLHFLKLKI